MSNINFDENTINKLKDMMNKGELNDVISQIPPEMIQNFSSMMNNNNQNNSNNSSNNDNNSDSNNVNNHNNSSNNFDNKHQNSNNSFDFSNIDINTIMKMKSVMDKMNNSNNPSSNLLHSLKPYLRESRREKVDQYANLLNIAQISGLFNNDNSQNNRSSDNVSDNTNNFDNLNNKESPQ